MKKIIITTIFVLSSNVFAAPYWNLKCKMKTTHHVNQVGISLDLKIKASELHIKYSEGVVDKFEFFEDKYYQIASLDPQNVLTITMDSDTRSEMLEELQSNSSYYQLGREVILTSSTGFVFECVTMPIFEAMN